MKRRDSAEEWARDFWGKVKTAYESACWNWAGTSRPVRPGSKYMQAKYANRIGRPAQKAIDDLSTFPTVGRIAYRLTNGPIPAGMDVDHICFNPLCCNPAHLQLLTRSENSARRNPNGGKFSSEQIAEVFRVALENPKATAKFISDQMVEGLRVNPRQVLYILSKEVTNDN